MGKALVLDLVGETALGTFAATGAGEEERAGLGVDGRHDVSVGKRDEADDEQMTNEERLREGNGSQSRDRLDAWRKRKSYFIVFWQKCFNFWEYPFRLIFLIIGVYIQWI